MEFKDSSIKRSVSKLNTEYYIPSFQRGIEWDKKQIIDLFDSVLKDYYIGGFLFWKLNEEIIDTHYGYKFINSYVPDSKAPTSKISALNRPEIVEPGCFSNNGRQMFVLDGQQRLTAFNVGLNGSLWTKKYQEKYDDPESWVEKTLQIDLLQTNPKSEDFKIKFRKPDNSGVDDNNNSYWLEFNKIMDYKDEEELTATIINEISASSIKSSSREKTKKVTRIIEIIYSQFVTGKSISYHQLSSEQRSPGEMHNIFIRANDSGTQLRDTDMLLAKSTPVWFDESEQIPREEFSVLTQRLNDYQKNIGLRKFDVGDIVETFYLITLRRNSIRRLNNSHYTEALTEFKSDEFQKKFKKLIDIIENRGLTLRVFPKRLIQASIYILYHYEGEKDWIEDNLPELLYVFQVNPNLRPNIIFKELLKLEEINSSIAKDIEDKLDGTEHSLLLDPDVDNQILLDLNRAGGNDIAKLAFLLRFQTYNKSNLKRVVPEEMEHKYPTTCIANYLEPQNYERIEQEVTKTDDTNEFLETLSRHSVNKINDRIKSQFGLN